MKRNIIYSFLIFFISLFFIGNVNAAINPYDDIYDQEAYNSLMSYRLPNKYNHYIYLDCNTQFFSGGYGIIGVLIEWNDNVGFDVIERDGRWQLIATSYNYTVYNYNNSNVRIRTYVKKTNGSYTINSDHYTLMGYDNSYTPVVYNGYSYNHFLINAYSDDGFYSLDDINIVDSENVILHNVLNYDGKPFYSSIQSFNSTIRYYNYLTGELINDNVYTIEDIIPGTKYRDLSVPNGLMSREFGNYNWKVMYYVFSSNSSDIFNVDRVEDLFNYELKSTDTYIDVYVRPNFDINFSSSWVCDKEGIDSLISRWDVINNYSDDDFNEFKYYLTYDDFTEEVFLDGSRYSTLIYAPTQYIFEVRDKNNNFIAIDYGYITDEHIDNVPVGYVSKILPKDTQFVFISHLSDVGVIFYNSYLNNHIKGYYYNIETKEKIELSSLDVIQGDLSSVNMNNFGYDFTDKENTILLLEILSKGFFRVNNGNSVIYAPAGAYFDIMTQIDYLESSVDGDPSVKPLPTPEYRFDYKDDEGEVHHIVNSSTDSVDTSGFSSFFSKFSSYINNFKDDVNFIGKFLNTLTSSMDSHLSYLLFAMFGLIVVAVVIRIWL